MTSRETTREVFHAEVEVALAAAQRRLRDIYGDPAIALSRVHHGDVAAIVAPWQRVLNWNYALMRASAIHRSCFVGLHTGASAELVALALIRVSRHRVRTSLLFLQKDGRVQLPAGRAMAMMDVILIAVASVFESTTVAIDDPLPDLISYYGDYGYTTKEWRDRRLLLTKRA